MDQGPWWEHPVSIGAATLAAYGLIREIVLRFLSIDPKKTDQKRIEKTIDRMKEDQRRANEQFRDDMQRFHDLFQPRLDEYGARIAVMSGNIEGMAKRLEVIEKDVRQWQKGR